MNARFQYQIAPKSRLSPGGWKNPRIRPGKLLRPVLGFYHVLHGHGLPVRLCFCRGGEHWGRRYPVKVSGAEDHRGIRHTIAPDGGRHCPGRSGGKGIHASHPEADILPTIHGRRNGSGVLADLHHVRPVSPGRAVCGKLLLNLIPGKVPVRVGACRPAEDNVPGFEQSRSRFHPGRSRRQAVPLHGVACALAGRSRQGIHRRNKIADIRPTGKGGGIRAGDIRQAGSNGDGIAPR